MPKCLSTQEACKCSRASTACRHEITALRLFTHEKRRSRRKWATPIDMVIIDDRRFNVYLHDIGHRRRTSIDVRREAPINVA